MRDSRHTGAAPARRPLRGRLAASAAVSIVVILGTAGALRVVGPEEGLRYGADQALAPEIRFDGSSVHIRNLRAFVYDADSVAERRWVDRSYDLDDVRRVWFVLSPFASWRGPAHSFLSFEMADSQFVSISVEARKEPHESYSPLKGLLRRYELMLVVGEESDVIGMRTQVYGDPVYLYPARATPEQARDLFVALLRRAEQVHTRPEFYNTFWNNCATNLADAVNQVTPGRMGWNHALVMPGYSDDWAARIGLLELDSEPAAVRERYRINDRAAAAYGRPDFSLAIRRGAPPAR